LKNWLFTFLYTNYHALFFFSAANLVTINCCDDASFFIAIGLFEIQFRLVLHRRRIAGELRNREEEQSKGGGGFENFSKSSPTKDSSHIEFTNFEILAILGTEYSPKYVPD